MLETVAPKHVVQLACASAQIVQVADVHGDGAVTPQLADVLIDEIQRGVRRPFARGVLLLAPIGKSTYSGGLFGFGDHAAAPASCERRLEGSNATSAGVFTAASAASSAGVSGRAARGVRQHGLMT